MNAQPTQLTESFETKEGLEMFWGDKPREVVSTWSGFTPAPDILIKEYGYMTALVWGRVWRYCQMSDGICRASIDTIAKELGMADNTIVRHLEPLCRDGYLDDTTPDLRNRPHIYADTGKVVIRMYAEAKVSDNKKPLPQRVVVAPTESGSDYPTEGDEESIKKESKKEKITLSPEEIKQANQKVDKILELNRKSSSLWKGRDSFRDNHLKYADWYNQKTGQECGKKSQRSWQKAFSDWQDEELDIPHLQEAYEQDVVWKKVIADPNELTKKAVAIKAMRTMAVARMEQQVTGSSSGYYA